MEDNQGGCCKSGDMGQGHACHWNNQCRCMHHRVVPMLLVLLGLAFLLENLGLLSSGFVGLAWPVLVMLIGLQKMMGLSCKCWNNMGK